MDVGLPWSEIMSMKSNGFQTLSCFSFPRGAGGVEYERVVHQGSVAPHSWAGSVAPHPLAGSVVSWIAVPPS
jgi:hypothetical protein